VGVADRVDGQQRRLGLHVVDVGRVGDACGRHRLLHALGDLLHHRDAADVLGQQDVAHRVADGQPGLVGLLDGVLGEGGEDRGVRADDAVRAAGPHDGDLLDLLERPRALLHQHLAERAVGDDPRVVVDPAVALGLADDGDDAVGLDDAFVDELGQLGRVAHVVQRDLADLDRCGHWGSFQGAGGTVKG
jgi:hypothetical protein